MKRPRTDQTCSSSSPKLIPMDILIDILTRLPSKSLVRFGSVSRFFYSLIRTPNFITNHFNRSSNANASLLVMPVAFKANINYSILCETTLLQHSHFKILPPSWNEKYSRFGNHICFCNGVICISSHSNILYLCNPSLRKLKILPPSCIDDVFTVFRYVFGFGVDNVSGDYKVVRIFYYPLSEIEEVQAKAEVYSLRSDSWKRLELDFNLPAIVANNFLSVFCNGAIHWIADEFLDRPRVILCFDLRDEVFREMQLPIGMPFTKRGYVFLFKELLSVFIKTDNDNPDNSLEYEVWIMKEYGVVESWTKEFTGLVEGVDERDIRFTKNGKVILRKRRGMLAILDLECGRLEDIGIHLDFYRVSDYVESLVLLEDGFSLSAKLLERIPAMVQGVQSEDPALQMEATTQFRKLLLIVPCTPIDEVIKAGVVPRFVEFLGRNDLPQLQFEAAWALTNVASGSSEHTQEVIEHGAVPIFVQLLSSASDDVREQAAWALANVAGDSATARDLVLSHGALLPLLAQLNENSRLSILRNATWTLSNFCRVKPLPPFVKVKPALPVLRKLIHLKDEEVLTYACWSLSFLSDGPNDTIQAMFEAGVCPRLVELMLHSSPKVILPAAQTVGNIVTGNDAQTQFVIDNHVLHSLYQLLTKNHQMRIKKDACWTISNITAGNRNQIQAVIEAKIIPPLLHLLQHAEFNVKVEAGWAISNAIVGGSHEQIRYLVSQGCIKSLCDLLICPEDYKIVNQCLKGLENILKLGETDKEMGMNVYEQMVDECKDPWIYVEAVNLLKKYSHLANSRSAWILTKE